MVVIVACLLSLVSVGPVVVGSLELGGPVGAARSILPKKNLFLVCPPFISLWSRGIIVKCGNRHCPAVEQPTNQHTYIHTLSTAEIKQSINIIIIIHYHYHHVTVMDAPQTVGVPSIRPHPWQRQPPPVPSFMDLESQQPFSIASATTTSATTLVVVVALVWYSIHAHPVVAVDRTDRQPFFCFVVVVILIILLLDTNDSVLLNNDSNHNHNQRTGNNNSNKGNNDATPALG